MPQGQIMQLYKLIQLSEIPSSETPTGQSPHRSASLPFLLLGLIDPPPFLCALPHPPRDWCCDVLCVYRLPLSVAYVSMWIGDSIEIPLRPDFGGGASFRLINPPGEGDLCLVFLCLDIPYHKRLIKFPELM